MVKALICHPACLLALPVCKLIQPPTYLEAGGPTIDIAAGTSASSN